MKKLPAQHYTYDLDYLEMARGLLMNGVVILNPRQVGVIRLDEADAAWLADLGLYLQTMRYYEKQPKQVKRAFRTWESALTESEKHG